METPVKITHAEWHKRGEALFGSNYRNWKFKCPICGHVASVGDFEKFKDKGAMPNSATSECIGRYIEGSEKAFSNEPKPKREGPCNYAIYGLFRIVDMVVVMPNGEEINSFGFAEKN